MISFCIIGKNEEAILDKCLSALAPYGCEIVFVDTGSTDRTRNIALKYTDKVYDFAWVNDFSAARNFSIEKASNDYIIPIDCDEIVTEFKLEETERLIKKYPDSIGRLMRINEFTREGDVYDSNEPVSRLFDRRIYCYRGTIHEQLVRRDGGEASFYRFPLTMLHSGYEGNLELRKKKTERNRRLLLEELKKRPDDTYILYQIGKSYYMEQNFDDALRYFERATELDMDPRLEYVQNCIEAYGYSLINLKMYDKALGLIGVYDEFAVTSDFVFLMGLIYMYNGMLDEAVAEFLKATKMTCVKVHGTNSYRAFYNIGVIYECIGDIDSAKNYYKMAGEFEPAIKRFNAIRDTLPQ